LRAKGGGSLALALGLLGCEPGVLTSLERQALLELTLRAAPADPTNAVADRPEAVVLGHQLFFDARYSGPLRVGDDGRNGALGAIGERGRVACVSCHDPARGGADWRSGGGTSLGAGWTGRAAPTVLNAALQPTPWMFWDGRTDSLWSQALGPPEGDVEINSSRLEVAHLLHDRYRAPYEALFGAMPDLSNLLRFPAAGRPGQAAFDGMTPDDQQAIDRIYANFGKAIAAYERKLVDRDSAFDRFMRGDESAMSESAIRGAKLFVGRAACDECHSGPTLGDGKFHNHGVPQTGPAIPREDLGRAAGIPHVKSDRFNAAGRFSDAPMRAHLDTLAATPLDVGAFKTPTLRNCAHTARTCTRAACRRCGT
jgi:cytochrome c peroxidase